MKIVRNSFQILYILVLFLFSNCQNDTIVEARQEEAVHQKSPFKSTIVSKQDIENNNKLSDRMRRLSTLQQNGFAESSDSELYDFTIDASYVKLVENVETNIHSYTFPVIRENSNSSVENVVFSYNELTEDYDASLVTYHFTASQRQEFLTSRHVNSSYEITYEQLALNLADVYAENSEPCTITYIEYHIPYGSTNSYQYSTNGYVNNQCEHENDDDPCSTYTDIVIFCPVSSSSSNDNATDDNTTNDSSNPSTSGGNGNTTNGSTNDDTDDETTNIITSPITREESTQQSILDCINGVASFNSFDSTTIDTEIIDQNDLTMNDWLTLNNYLQANGCSEEAQEEVIEDLIEAYDDYKIINELEGKALCVYNKLKKLKGGFKESIKKFDGDFPVAHLKFESAPLSGTTKGSTYPPLNGTSPNVNSPDYQILIQINNLNNRYGHPQRPNLLIAKTIIHEVIHAEMFRKLLTLAKQGHLDFTGLSAEEQTNLMLSIRENFPGIFDYMTRLNNWQHQQMAAHYRESIARLLQEFDTGVPVPSTEQPQQLYMDLSWEGLIYENGSDAVQAWISLPQTERTRIELVISNYITNNLNENCTE